MRPVPSSDDGQTAKRGQQPQDGCVEAGALDGARADELVVARVDPGAAADVRRGEQIEQRLLRAGPIGPGRGRRRLPRLAVHLVARSLVSEQLRRDRAHDVAIEERSQLAGIGHLAHGRGRELPAGAHLLDCGQLLRLDDSHHSLLALGDHDLPRLHVLLAERDAVEVDVDSLAAFGHLRQRGGEPGRAAVLQRHDQVALDELGRDLDQLLAVERVADLDRGPLLGIVLAELLAGEHARAADPVAARRGAVEDDEVPRPLRARRLDAVGRQEPDAHRVHEAVVAVRLVEDRVAADRGDSDAVPVVADARDGALELPARLTEAQPVEQRNRARAHGDDVAEDPADPGRSALKRLHRARVVVALDLERDRLTLAEVDHARVLARPLQHACAFRRKAAQQRRRVLVRAVLRPEQREDGELEMVRLAAQQLLDTVELPVGQPEGAVKRLFRDRRQVVQSSAASGLLVTRPPMDSL